MFQIKVSKYKNLLARGEMCFIETQIDIEALKIAMNYKNKNFNIKTIIFQNKRRQEIERINI